MPFFNHITLPLPHAHPTPLCLTFEILLNMLHNRMSILGNVHEIHKIAQKAAAMRDHVKAESNTADSNTSFWSVYSTYYMSTLKFVMHFEIENNDWKGEFCDRLRKQNAGTNAPVGVIGKVRMEDSMQSKWFAAVPQVREDNAEGWQFFCCDNEVLEMRWEGSDADLKTALAKHNWFPFQLEIYGLELKVVNHELSRLVSESDLSFSQSAGSAPASPAQSTRSALSSPASQASMYSTGGSSSRFQTMTPPTHLAQHFGDEVRTGDRRSTSGSMQDGYGGNPTSASTPQNGFPIYSQQETSWIKPSPSLHSQQQQAHAMQRSDSSSSSMHQSTASRNVPQLATVHSNGRMTPQFQVQQSSPGYNNFNQAMPESPQLHRRSRSLSSRSENNGSLGSAGDRSPSKSFLHSEIDRLRKTIATLEGDKRRMQLTIDEQDRMLQQIQHIMLGYNKR